MSPLTVEQYLSIEREAAFRNEFLNGEVVAMSGGQQESRHGRRRHSQSANVPAFPDIVVFREPARFLDDDEDTLLDAVGPDRSAFAPSRNTCCRRRMKSAPSTMSASRTGRGCACNPPSAP